MTSLKPKIVIRGAGDLATGVAARLWRSGFTLIMTEIELPLTVRRSVAFSEAVYKGSFAVEDLEANIVYDPSDIQGVLESNKIPVLIDPAARIKMTLPPDVLVDAIMAKKNLGTSISDAPLVIGLGPGFTAGKDVHAVIETKRGHFLGRVIWSGQPEPDTGIPAEVCGYGKKRVVRAPEAGIFNVHCQIGRQVSQNDLLGCVNGSPVLAPISGVLRGLLHDQVPVRKDMKIGDIDPRSKTEHCWTISDKSLAVGGGVLEAILASMDQFGCITTRQQD